MPLKFEWDNNKAISNERKHGVTFEEASTVLSDFLSITIPDPLHSGTKKGSQQLAYPINNASLL